MACDHSPKGTVDRNHECTDRHGCAFRSVFLFIILRTSNSNQWAWNLISAGVPVKDEKFCSISEDKGV